MNSSYLKNVIMLSALFLSSLHCSKEKKTERFARDQPPSGQSGGSNAGEKKPESDPDSAGSKINTAGWQDSPFMSLDGKKILFMYTPYNFIPIFQNPPGSAVKRCPDRPGHLTNPSGNPFEDSDLYVTELKADGSWSTPAHLAGNTTGADCCAMWNRNESILVYQKPKTEGSQDTDLHIAYRLANGSYGTSNPLTSVNTTSQEQNPHLSDDGLAIYFMSDRPGGYGKKDLYIATRASTSANFGAPVNMGNVINTAAEEDQIWVSPNQQVIYFNRDNGIFRSTRTGNTWTAPVLQDLGMLLVGEASLTEDESKMVFAGVDLQAETIRLFITKKNGSGWSNPTPLD